jgi:TonB family protein
MMRVEQRCLFGSAGFHAALLLLLLLSPKLVPTPSVVPVLTLIPTDLKVTDGDKMGGGSPTAKPPAQSPVPKLQAPPVAKPELKPEAKPEVKPQLKPEPLPEAPPKPESKVTPPKAKLRPTPSEPQIKINPEIHSQDTDPALKSKPKKLRTKDEIRTADQPKKFSKSELEEQRREAQTKRREAEEAEAEREAQRQAESQRRARAAQVAQLNADRARIANAIGGAASVVGKTLAGSTTIEMPGPGGQAYAPYRSYLAAFYKERWRNKPASISSASAGVMVEIIIARDGRLLDWRVTQSSGVRELDQSVKDLLPKYPRLLPLPEGSTDPQRTFRILFTLEADTPA